jgi:hypothetical protein
MTPSDFILLGKKILVGILVAVIPFLILFGGILLTQRLLTKETEADAKPLLTKPDQSYENGRPNP